MAEAAGSGSAETDRDLEMRVVDTLRDVYDPEIPVNIYELGLIYNVAAARDGTVEVVMTLTTPHCPVAETMPGEIEARIRGLEGVSDVKLDLVWDPPWTPEMMSEAARLELGFL
ncbi:MAG: SUF system Fe-S cluster assembly protein [Sneathiellaceae bacterium]